MEKILEMSQPFVFKAVNLDSKPVSNFPKVSRELVTEGAVTGTQGACSVPSCLQTNATQASWKCKTPRIFPRNPEVRPVISG